MSLKLLCVVLAVVFLIQPAYSKNLTGPSSLPNTDLAAIRDVIVGQFDAFRHDDAEKAFSFAAPRIKKIFGTPEVFIRMVRESYGAVYRPETYRFRDVKHINGQLVQPVTVVGPSGITETALYIMEIQPDGSWRIGGCIMAQKPGDET